MPRRLSQEARVKALEEGARDAAKAQYNFLAHGKRLKFADRSLFLFTASNPVRQKIVWLITSRAFEIFILALILANSAVLGMADYSTVDADGDLDSRSWRNKLLEESELFFTTMFIIEACLKIVGMGFFVSPGSYLRDGWNVMDFIVVVSGLPFLPNVSAFRTIRVLRPLRSLTVVPGMRLLVMSLLGSIPSLVNVILLMAFVFTIFGILGVQLWSGQLHARCRLTELPVLLTAAADGIGECTDGASEGCLAATLLTEVPSLAQVWAPALGMFVSTQINTTALARCLPGDNDAGTDKDSSVWNTARPCFWPIDLSDTRVCSLEGGGAHTCPPGRWCGSNFDDYGNHRFVDSMFMKSGTFIPDLNFGFTNFDNIFRASNTIFQSITMEGWVDVMYQVMDAHIGIVAALYFVLLILFGSFFLLNLTLAVIWDNFSESQDAEAARVEYEGAKTSAALIVATDAAAPSGAQEVKADPGGGHAAPAVSPAASPAASRRASGTSEHGRSYPHIPDAMKAPLFPAPSTETGVKEEALPTHTTPNRPPVGARVAPLSAAQEPAAAVDVAVTAVGAGAQAGPWAQQWRNKLYHVVTSTWFTIVIGVLIVVNTIVLAADHHPMSDATATNLEVCNFLLTMMFTLEMVLKLAGLGFRGYIRDSFNVFDGIIVLVSLLEIALAPPGFLTGDDSTSSTGAVSALRTFRLFRVFKFARSWRSLRTLLATIVKTLKDVGNFAVLLLLFMFIFALVGMQFFANQFCFNPDTGEPSAHQGQPNCPDDYPRAHFDDLLWAFVTVFQILTGENWNTVMYDGWRAGNWVAVIYFVTLVILGNFIVLNLFLAILLGNFEGMEELVNPDAQPASPVKLLSRVTKYLSARLSSRMGSKSPSHMPSPAKPPAIGVNQLAASRPAPLLAAITEGGDTPAKTGRQSTPARRASAETGRASAPSAPLPGAIASPEEGKEPVVTGVHLPSLSPKQRPPSGASATRRLHLDSPTNAKPAEEDAKPTPSTVDAPEVTSPLSSMGGSAAPYAGSVTTTHMDDRSPGAESMPPPISSPTVRSPAAGAPAPPAGAYGTTSGMLTSSKTISTRSNPPATAVIMPGGPMNAAAIAASQPDTGRPKKEVSIAVPPSQESVAGDDGDGAPAPLRGKSLCVFSAQHPFRVAVANFVRNKYFENAILALIFTSSILLAVDNPLLDPDSALVKVLLGFDIFFAIVFTLEAACKIVTWGFLLGKDTYLRSGWNVLDFLIVIISILSLVAAGNSGLRSLRSLRTLRALRPLRVISRRPGLRLIVNALFASWNAIMNVLFVCALFFMIFGIVGVNYFKGTFNHCTGDGLDTAPAAIVAALEDPVPFGAALGDAQAVFAPTGYAAFTVEAPSGRQVCSFMLEAGFDVGWERVVPENFDNILAAMGTLFEMATTEGWVDIMYAGVDARGIDAQPRRDAQPAWVLFFVFFMIVGSFFVLNLFVGVVIDNFNNMKERIGGSAFLTEAQREWVRTKRLMNKMRPLKVFPCPENKIRAAAFRVAQSIKFEVFIMSCIIVNTIIMAMEYFGQSDAYGLALVVLNFIFAGIFTLEAAIKLTGLSWRYFSDSWNVFDFTIVVGTIVGIVLQAALGIELGSIATVVRTFRVGRIFRLIKQAKRLNQLFQTLLLTLPSLGNIGGLLFLLFFIYAVMGVQLFATVQLGDSLNEQANFQDFWTAVLTLMRASTGEAWNYIMYDMARTSSDCQSGILDLDYSINKNKCGFTDADDCIPLDGCGSIAAYPYFVSFTLLITFIFLNLFIAVILEGFGETGDDEVAKLSTAHFEQYAQEWAKFDPDGTGRMPSNKMSQLLRSLPAPMGFADGPPPNKQAIRRRLVRLDLTVKEDKVQFVELATALAKVIFEDAAMEEGKTFRLPPKEEKEVLLKKQSSRATLVDLNSYFAAMAIQKALLNYRAKKEAKLVLDRRRTVSKTLD